MNRFAIFLFSLLVSLPGVADEIPMHALVIGNSAYPEGQLKNPANDAQLMAETLRPLGFDVTVKTNLDQETMDKVVSDFASSLQRGSVALFFYAGHGVQDRNKRNYLIPVNAKLHSEASIQYKTMSLDFVVDCLENSKSNLNVVVLDCCRDNPFERSWARTAATRGLASIEAPEGTIIAHSTASGATASDGDGVNSPYTTQLTKALRQGSSSGVSLVDMFRQASRAVWEGTKQRPFLEFDATMPKFHLSASAGRTSEAQLGSPLPVIESTGSAVSSSVPMLPPEEPVVTNPNLPPSAGQVASQASNHPLLQQAVIYQRSGQHDLAIEAFTALVTDTDLPAPVRGEARRGRGSVYLARRASTEDINRAIIDHKATGAKGLHVSVLADQANLMDGTKVAGVIRQNEIAFITDSRGKWSLVKSVGGDPQRHGWVKIDALVARTPPGMSASSTQTPRMPAETQPSSQASGQPKRQDVPPVEDDPEVVAFLKTLPPNYKGRLGVFMDATLDGPEVVVVIPGGAATRCRVISGPPSVSVGDAFSLRKHDLVVSINGAETRDAAEALNRLLLAPRSSRMTIVRDGGSPIRLAVELNEDPKPLPPVPPLRRGLAAMNLQSVGISVVDHSANGIAGLRVTSIKPGSLADGIMAKGVDFEAKMAPGDLITTINHYRVRSIAEADRAVSNDSKPGGWRMRLKFVNAQRRQLGIYFIFQ